MFDQGKNNKQFIVRKCTDIQYHVKDGSDAVHQDERMYCKTNQLPALIFCGPYSKPHDARVLINHYHLRFDQKLGNGICAICHIPCACVTYTSMLDKPCISGIPSYVKERYRHVTKCTYWKVLGYFNNWNIIQFSQKSTPSDAFDEIHQVVLDGISDNIA